MTTITKNKLFLVLGFAALASCKSYDIKPGSERIRVFESEPKGCIFLGEIPRDYFEQYQTKKTYAGGKPLIRSNQDRHQDHQINLTAIKNVKKTDCV